MRYINSNMKKSLITKDLMCYVVLFLFCSFSLKGVCQIEESTVATLVKMGFENVGCTEDDKERVYVIQNSAYRLQGVGIGKAVDVIQKMGLPDGKPCRIIVLDNNVPQISLFYQPTHADSLSAANRQDWNVSYDLGDTWKQARKIKKENSSLFKVDIVVYPELSLKNLVITQVYQVLFNLSPTIEVSLWKGMSLTAQMVVPIYNDGFEMMSEAVHNVYDRVHPGCVSLSQTVRLPYNTWATLSVGHFMSNRYGIDLAALHVLKADERFSFEGRVGYTGACYWDAFTCHFDSRKVWTWHVGANFFWPYYNLQTSVKLIQHIQGEKSVRCDVIRHFKYVSIGFYGEKANRGIRANAGFRFQIALPPYRYKRKGYIPRVTPSENFGMSYNAGNERNYYKTYRTTPSDNIMRNNSLNPYFIKSELLNY
ncbi:hypothetical protein [Bacteroides sp.]|uniref:hypothetical protein n=1 Tax=Bacteroides sp. TaxID=29523 RepID=UPI0026383DE6|nr:hypothetical protein [Bacteroides sp.]MDD3037619.1 hypothetical protein [Bacteroides sp.]